MVYEKMGLQALISAYTSSRTRSIPNGSGSNPLPHHHNALDTTLGSASHPQTRRRSGLWLLGIVTCLPARDCPPQRYRTSTGVISAPSRPSTHLPPPPTTPRYRTHYEATAQRLGIREGLCRWRSDQARGSWSRRIGRVIGRRSLYTVGVAREGTHACTGRFG